MVIETRMRTLVKTISWRITATLTTVLLVWLFTGEVLMAFAIGSVEVFAKMLIFYVHDRAWAKLSFGKRELKPQIAWFTGLSASGKGALAQKVAENLKELGVKVEFINGEEIRSIVPDIGFGREERILHIKRVGYLAKKLEENGVFVVASFISPDVEAREFVRKMCNDFFEVHVSTPLEVCKAQDSKGIYRRAEQGQLKNVAGIDIKYEPSPNVEYEVNLAEADLDSTAKSITALLEERM